ncbi:MAG: SDR family oxidoreductase [Gammaproteobacteria bacterium]|nr:SDR family oxidoreductase [Gammaproteobacteria bacterium]
MNRPDSSAQITPKVDLAALDKLFDLTGVRAFLPGGYGALGEAIAWAFAKRGADIAIAGPNRTKAESLAENLLSAGGKAIGLELNARKTSDIPAVVDKVVAALGGIDVMINCVGIQREQSLLDVTEEAFDEVYETNLKSAMFLSQAVARHQIKAGNGGRHIHLLSVRSKLALRGRGYSAYCATKGGLLMLVRQHAVELAEHNITVNGVAPTFIKSDRIRTHLERDEFRKFIVSRNPMGRIGEPVEVVGQVIAFAAPAGSYVTGQVVYVDGGITASQ